MKAHPKITRRDQGWFRSGAQAGMGLARPIVKDWLDILDADGAECTCVEDNDNRGLVDECPRCRAEHFLMTVDIGIFNRPKRKAKR